MRMSSECVILQRGVANIELIIQSGSDILTRALILFPTKDFRVYGFRSHEEQLKRRFACRTEFAKTLVGSAL